MRYSGRIARRKQNHVTYQKRISDKPQTQREAFPGLPSISIPSLLKEHAANAITLPPSTSFFQSAYKGADELADTDYSDKELERWNGVPPYTEGLENKTRQWLSANIQNLSDALWGKCLRQQHEFEVRRIGRYKSVPRTDFIVEVYEDLMFYLRSWEGANRVMEQFSGDNGATLELGMQYVQWTARRTLHLSEDYQALKEGSDAILRGYVERWIRVLSCSN
jgi:hypothetical protein